MSGLVPIYGRAGIVAYATVDDADLALVSQYRWNLSDKGYVVSAVYLGGGRAHTRLLRLKMHRVILGLETGDPLQGDHRNGDRLDNQRSNLRILTGAQNAQNRRDRRGRSLHRGVYFDVTRGKWRAQVSSRGRTVSRYFEDEDQAADWAVEKRRGLLPFSEEVASSQV